MKFRIEEEINDKSEASNIDFENLNISKALKNFTYKPYSLHSEEK